MSEFDYSNGGAYGTLPVSTKPQNQLDSILESVQNIEALSLIPAWRSDWKKKRALEASRILRDYGDYDGLLWNVTSGVADPFMKLMTRWKYPDYQENFSRRGRFGSLYIPDSDVSIDIPHFNAALSGYLDCYNDDCAIPTEWASWAGDMFTYAAHLDSVRKNDGLGYFAIRDSALNNIGGSHERYSKYFGSKDFYADIDARNIASLINNRGMSLYESMDNYYRQKAFDRFG
ncbi:MAG: hypothetical protein HUK19_06410, partial [Fibrobacter sp.]|nr:hypothetical protein [Fibrobacter sp.]